MTGSGTGINEWNGRVGGNESIAAAAAAVWLLSIDGSKFLQKNIIRII